MVDLPEDPDFSEYLESDNSVFQLIGLQLKQFHDQMLNNWELMPSQSSFWETADILEPRVRKTYEQTFMITLMGLDRASLILQGVLLEQVVRELYYVVNDEESDKNFHNTLGCLKSEISEENYDYIKDYKDEVRNNWIHDDTEDIAEDIKLKGKEISFSSENPEELLEEVKENRNNLTEEMSIDDHRFIGDIIMNQRDRSAILLYPSTDKVVGELAQKIHEGYKDS
jgi:hypothetical protein